MPSMAAASSLLTVVCLDIIGRKNVFFFPLFVLVIVNCVSFVLFNRTILLENSVDGIGRRGM